MANTVVINVQANTATATADLTATTVAVDNLTTAEKKLNKETGKTSSQFENVSKNGGAVAILDQLTGGLASRMRDTFEATKLFNFSLKGMRTALIATGVGAFVVALGVIVAYWDEITDYISGASKKLQEYIDKQNQLLKDVRTELTILQKQKELADLRGDSIDAINKKIEQSLLLEKKETLALLNTLEAQLKIEESKQKELSTMDKLAIKAVEIFGVNQQTLLLMQAASQDEKNFQEKLDEINTLRTKVADLDIEIQTFSNETANRTRETLAVVTELTTEGIVAVDNTILQSNELTADSFVIKKGLTEKEIDDAKTAADAKKSIRDAELDNIANGVNVLAKLAPKSRALQAAGIIASNAVGIAKIIQQTTAANTAAKLKYALIPGGTALAAAEIAANKVSAGINIATSLAATAKGLSALKAGGSAGSSVSLPAEGGGGGVAQEPAFNIVGQGAGSQIASALGEQQQTPIQAFVVAQDVTTAQSLENGIIQGATLGG
jgi:hypothetical protein